MPKVVGGIMAIVALGASMLAGVDPLTTLWRGLLALTTGVIATQVWYIFFAIRVSTFNELANPLKDKAPGKPEAPEEESARAA